MCKAGLHAHGGQHWSSAAHLLLIAQPLVRRHMPAGQSDTTPTVRPRGTGLANCQQSHARERLHGPGVASRCIAIPKAFLNVFVRAKNSCRSSSCWSSRVLHFL